MTSLKESLLLTQGGVVSIVGAGGKTSLMFRIARELSQAGESVLTTTTTKILMPREDQSPKVIVSGSLEELLNTSGEMVKDAEHITAASALLTVGFDSRARQEKTRYRQKLVGFQTEFVDEIYKAGVFRWILVEADGAAGRPLKAPDPHEPVIPKSSVKIIGVLGLDGVGKALIDKWVFRPHRFSQITGRGDGEIVTESDCVMAIVHKDGILKGSPGGAKCLLFLNKADRPGKLAVARKIVRLLEQRGDSVLQRIIIGQALHQPPVIEYYDLPNL